MSIALVSQLLSEKESEINLAACELVSLLGPDQLDLDLLEPLVVEINNWVQKQPNSRVQTAIDRLLGRVPMKSSKTARTNR